MKKSLVLTGLLLLLSLPALSAVTTIVAAADHWPPFADENNPDDGLSLEIVRAAYKTQDFDVKMKFVPWVRAEEGVKEGVYDILVNVWRTEARATELFFSTPYTSNSIKFIKLKNNPFEYHGINSLDGVNLGTVRGYGYGEELAKPTRFFREDANSFISNVRKLVARRIDLTLEDEIVARFIINKEAPKLLEQVEFTKNPFSSNPLYIAAGLKNPKHREIIESFNKGYEIIKADGTLDKIFIKYGSK